ncbi:hypothetical protein QR98_0038290 [Sarcoptes scabiei]|uniref:Uncharacterized protein n=1 Tax=Sarcoptes scabiei TaxID=52283 RepID=A0A132A2X8_SARSC|nr:hypothetical protein QR98_0038290 [Sarcoptes scabiei]
MKAKNRFLAQKMIYSRLVNGYEKANDFDDEDYDDGDDDDDDDRNGFDPITTDEACFLTYLNAPRGISENFQIPTNSNSKFSSDVKQIIVIVG